MLNYLLGLDKIIYKFVFTKCLKLGSIFYLGAFEGFVIYTLIIILSIVKVQEARRKGATK